MKKIIFTCFLLVLWGSAIAQAIEFSQFVTRAGRTTGQATTCKVAKEEIASFERALEQYVQSRWPNMPPQNFVQTFNSAMRAAQQESPPDFVTCQDIKLALWEATQNPASIAPATPIIKPEQLQAMQKKVATIGTRICHEETGTVQPIIGHTMQGPVYGKAVPRDYRIEGYTDAVNGSRIKVLINTISTNGPTGIQYLNELPPQYTKGGYVWHETLLWKLCE